MQNIESKHSTKTCVCKDRFLGTEAGYLVPKGKYTCLLLSEDAILVKP